MDRLKVTAYVITYNEEKKIKDCLESIKWADEIVVLDSFSTDRTVEICKEYADKVVQEKFEGFGKLRNTALAHTSNDWIFSLDSDERATEEIKNEILGLLAEGPKKDAYYVPRKTHFMGKWIRHCGWYPDYRQPQFFNKKKMKYTEQLVHETYELDGEIGYMKEHVLQFPFIDLDQYFEKMDRYSSLRAREMAKEGKKFSILNVIFNPIAMFVRMYIQKLGILDGRHGFILSLLYAYYTTLKYIKLWEKQESKNGIS